jgi:hypothetical protein
MVNLVSHFPQLQTFLLLWVAEGPDSCDVTSGSRQRNGGAGAVHLCCNVPTSYDVSFVPTDSLSNDGRNLRLHWTIHYSKIINKFYVVRFQVITAAIWRWQPSGIRIVVEVDRRFKGAYCFQHQGNKILKRRANSTRLHGAISQKAAMFKLYVV